MAYIISVNGSVFSISDGSNALVKNKEDILCRVSPSNTSVVDIIETSPNETERKIIFSSLYTNFGSPTGATAAIVVDGIKTILNTSYSSSGLPSQTGNAGKYLKTDGTTATWETVAAGGISVISSTSTFTFLPEDNYVINTVLNSDLTNANFKSFSALHISTTATSLDDFTLNGITFNIETINDNLSFDIRASSINNATGIYTITYKILYS